ncbi:MAG: TetR/AcrR family transcriptional regulator [Burkholderiales bacterium]|nr:TetR/AcrR family transcriptional regulator [Burkholderiales bacterium]
MKQRILEAADRLFYNQSIQAVGVDALAAKAGISKRTLYDHFPSKDAVVAAYLARRAAMVTSPTDGSPREQILALFDALAPWFGSKHFRGCPFINAVSELGAQHRHPGLAAARAAKAQRRIWLAERCQALNVADPAGLADQLMILREGAITASMMRGGDPCAGHAARAAAQVLLDAAVQPVRVRAR